MPGHHSSKILFSFPSQMELHPQDMASGITVPGKHNLFLGGGRGHPLGSAGADFVAVRSPYPLCSPLGSSDPARLSILEELLQQCDISPRNLSSPAPAWVPTGESSSAHGVQSGWLPGWVTPAPSHRWFPCRGHSPPGHGAPASPGHLAPALRRPQPQQLLPCPNISPVGAHGGAAHPGHLPAKGPGATGGDRCCGAGSGPGCGNARTGWEEAGECMGSPCIWSSGADAAALPLQGPWHPHSTWHRARCSSRPRQRSLCLLPALCHSHGCCWRTQVSLVGY